MTCKHGDGDMRKTITTAALLASTLSASASGLFNPPARYDHSPTSRVDIVRLSVRDLQKACFNKRYPVATMAGCAKHLKNPDRCVIFVANRPIVNLGLSAIVAPLVTPEMVLRHEMGHCNGWPANHPR